MWTKRNLFINSVSKSIAFRWNFNLLFIYNSEMQCIIYPMCSNIHWTFFSHGEVWVHSIRRNRCRRSSHRLQRNLGWGNWNEHWAKKEERKCNRKRYTTLVMTNARTNVNVLLFFCFTFYWFPRRKLIVLNKMIIPSPSAGKIPPSFPCINWVFLTLMPTERPTEKQIRIRIAKK